MHHFTSYNLGRAWLTNGSSMAYNCVRIQLGGPLQHCGELCTPFSLQAQVLLGLLLLQAPEQGGQLPPSSVPSQFWSWAGGLCALLSSLAWCLCQLHMEVMLLGEFWLEQDFLHRPQIIAFVLFSWQGFKTLLRSCVF